MSKTKRSRSRAADATAILDRMIGDDPRVRARADEAVVRAEVAQLVYDIRTRAGLTQRQLAQSIGAAPSIIARLEDADYEGPTLALLERIAHALNRRLEIRLAPQPRKIAA